MKKFNIDNMIVDMPEDKVSNEVICTSAMMHHEIQKRVAKKEAVNHPSHYNTGRIEVIDAIEDWKLDFSLGNAVKYVARCNKKDPCKEIEDLEKAIWYIKRRVENLQTRVQAESEEKPKI